MVGIDSSSYYKTKQRMIQATLDSNIPEEITARSRNCHLCQNYYLVTLCCKYLWFSWYFQFFSEFFRLLIIMSFSSPSFCYWYFPLYFDKSLSRTLAIYSPQWYLQHFYLQQKCPLKSISGCVEIYKWSWACCLH